MMEIDSKPALRFYGVTQRNKAQTDLEECVECVRRNGFAVLDSGFSDATISEIGQCFNRVRDDYISEHGFVYLQQLDEHNTVRLPMSFALREMLNIALSENLIATINALIDGTFILNQQNLIANPSKQDYNQSSWHRDLPYQHFTSSVPLAVNAIYCVDDFTRDNGASYVLPGSHKVGEFPSDAFVEDNQVQLSAPAGAYLILDCMTFHRGGYNYTESTRRAINQVFSIPHMKQQISIPDCLDLSDLDSGTQAILGAGLTAPDSTKAYLQSRPAK